MHICEFESRSFSFIVAGNTAHEAWDAMVNGWRRHCEQTSADINYMDRDDCMEHDISAGMCLRDGHQLL